MPRAGGAADGLQSSSTSRSYGTTTGCHAAGTPELLFTDNETNTERAVRDCPNRLAVRQGRVPPTTSSTATPPRSIPTQTGTKAPRGIRARRSARARPARIRLRLLRQRQTPTVRRSLRRRSSPTASREADEFYAAVIPRDLPRTTRSVMRQAFAGLLWRKQYYHYVVRDWLDGDPACPPPPPERDRAATTTGRTSTTPT